MPGTSLRLSTTDGHELGAYRADPTVTPRAGLVVIQEIFGVNAHIRSLVDRFAGEGYAAIAPALFDRVSRDVELTYDTDGVARGRALRGDLTWEGALADVDAAVAAVQPAGKVGVVGYCYGGSVAWAAAHRSAIQAAVGYYGGQIHELRHHTPRCPVMLHFGAEDTAIPLDDVQVLQRDFPDLPIFIYEAAGHGFSCDARGSYNSDAAQTAQQRTLAFFAEHLG